MIKYYDSSTAIRTKGPKKGLEEGEHRKAIAIAKNLLAEGRSPGAVQKLTALSEKEIMALISIKRLQMEVSL